MNKFTRKITLIILILTLIISQTACGVKNQNEGVSKESFLLDTICRIDVYGLDSSRLEIYKIIDQLDPNITPEKYALTEITNCFSLIGYYEDMLSKTKEGSDIYKINHANGEMVVVNQQTAELIERAIEYSELSDGVFDITIGKATDLWNFRNEAHTGTLPDKDELAEAITHVGYKNIVVDGNTVTLLDPEMQIDLGAIAKGYIADRAVEFLKIRGVVSGIVNLGGNVVTIGNKTSEMLPDLKTKYEEFKVGVNNPDGGDYLEVIKGGETTVVTSGTYERYFDLDGVRYHHVLDTKTGYPVDTNLKQVTIVGYTNTSVDCDALSTMCLALGVDKAKEALKDLTYKKAIFMMNDGTIETIEGKAPVVGTEKDPIVKIEVLPNEKNMTEGHEEKGSEGPILN